MLKSISYYLFLLLLAHRGWAHTHGPLGRGAQDREDGVSARGGVAGESLAEGRPVVQVLGLPRVSRALAALDSILADFLEDG